MGRAETRRALYRNRREAGLCPGCGAKPEAGRVKCRRCLGQQNKYDAKRKGTPRRDKAPEEPPEGPLKLWDMLEYEPATAGPMPSAGPVKKQPEPDPLALSPEIAERVRALRESYGVPADDTEGDEFAAWGPGPGSGRLLILSED